MSSRVQMNPKVAVSVVFVAAMFMSIMDSTVVNVALPALSRQFNVTGTAIDAIVVGYLVSLAVIIPVSGWLGDRVGTKRIFVSALVLFTVASALCGLATSLPMLVAFRVLQGLAGGALTPVGTAILYRTFPPEERVQVSRILNIPTVIAPATGPIIGGLLVDKLSWRWVFYINVPLGILASIFALFFLHEYYENTNKRFDILGFLLAGIGLALTMYALSEGPVYGWTNGTILGTGIVGLLMLVAFVFVELSSTHPMLDLHLFNNKLFRTCNLVTVFSGAGFMGLLYAAPLFLQEARGVSAFTSGLTTFPEALGVLVSTQIVARLYPKVGPRRLIAGGLIGVTIIELCMLSMGMDTSLWVMRGLMFLTGAGMAYAFIPVQAAAFATISPAETGQASALNNAQRQVGASLGVALISTVMSTVGMTHIANGSVQPNLTAYHAAFITSAILAVIAVSFALRVRDKDAASTMRQRGKQVEPEQVLESALQVEAGI
ncbi:MFS transporter [Ktedonobacter sp. SOSP1-85]|uniref:MDR family MFS transporter n=1 Tax=Ktedonobacter sp. SOSP1-85 TaxID=2778367 RepID=UPI0019151128|nr:MDR family MFS transporter [Ktedonobacter sp. SOSP1-85]GHO80515.1 MFS transporter [Ktedonobacter sp. SOSP1-85]